MEKNNIPDKFRFFNDDCIEEVEEEVVIEVRKRATYYKDDSDKLHQALTNFIQPTNHEPEIHKYTIKQKNLKIDNLNWFNLKNYEPLKNINRDKLFRLMEIRREINDNIDFYQGNLDIESYDINDEEFVENIKQEAIDKFKNKCLDYSFDNLNSIFIFGSKFDVTIKDSVYQVKHTDILNEIEMYKDQVDNGIDDFFNGTGKALLEVNLTVSDDKLIDEFKKWLSDKRKTDEIEISKRISDNDFYKMINYKVIPYIDLILWKKITGNKLTNKQISNLLFPNDLNIQEETIRKKVKELAEKLLYSDVNLI